MSDDEKQSQYWATRAAEDVIEKFPNEKVYTCAAGISPSGRLHFGNFRDLITAYAVEQELKRMGKQTRLIYSFDNYDRFRKVPKNVPEKYTEHLGKPLSAVPDPEGDKASYGVRFEEELGKATKAMGMEIEYITQTEKYTAGAYVEQIKLAMQKREVIGKILYSFISDKAKQERKLNETDYLAEYYPISVYSEFSGKDNTSVLSYDGEYTITYKCHDSDKESTINFKETPIVKLAWKVDWPMRWVYENVVFEPGGTDHSAPGSSFEVSSRIVKEVFGHEPPEFVEYGMVGISGQGSKMSGSKGNVVTPGELLTVYQASLLKWLYLRKRPIQTFSLSFGSEVIRQYDEFDRAVIALTKNDVSYCIFAEQLEASAIEKECNC